MPSGPLRIGRQHIPHLGVPVYQVIQKDASFEWGPE